MPAIIDAYNYSVLQDVIRVTSKVHALTSTLCNPEAAHVLHDAVIYPHLDARRFRARSYYRRSYSTVVPSFAIGWP